jgi:hypothetical protein
MQPTFCIELVCGFTSANKLLRSPSEDELAVPGNVSRRSHITYT